MKKILVVVFASLYPLILIFLAFTPESYARMSAVSTLLGLDVYISPGYMLLPILALLILMLIVMLICEDPLRIILKMYLLFTGLFITLIETAIMLRIVAISNLMNYFGDTPSVMSILNTISIIIVIVCAVYILYIIYQIVYALVQSIRRKSLKVEEDGNQVNFDIPKLDIKIGYNNKVMILVSIFTVIVLGLGCYIIYNLVTVING